MSGGSARGSTADLPISVQILNPSDIAVLPSGFARHAFRDSVVSTRAQAGNFLVSQDENVQSRPFVSLHPSFLQLVTPEANVTVLAQGEPGFAHEAGIWIPSTEEVWFTSNLSCQDATPNAAGLIEYTGKVSKVHVPTGKVTDILLGNTCVAGNGGCPFGDYVLLCDQGKGVEHPSQLVLVDPEDPTITMPILNNLQGRPFNSLNDVIVLPPPCHLREQVQEGSSRNPYPGLSRRIPEYGSTIWFTDPPYGAEQKLRPPAQLPPQVYCFEPYSGTIRCIADGFDHPNGIAFAPDGMTCYITDTSHIHGTGRLDPSLQSTIYAFDVFWPVEEPDISIAGPSLRNKRVFAFADTVKCDNQGNVYSGCGDGVHVWNKYGTLIGKIVLGLADANIPCGCANFCFIPGGRMVCFAEDRIYLVSGLAIEGDLCMQI